MKIAHTADVHIRGNKYIQEMEHSLKELVSSAQENSCEWLVIAGDLYHSKLTVTNEYFEICRNFLENAMNSGLKVLIIPGNHDLALNNPDRMDAITPVYNSLKDFFPDDIFYYKNSGLVHSCGDYNFWHFSCLDKRRDWPTSKDLKGHEDKINIALYHGTIDGSSVDSGWVSRGNKDGLSIFDKFDFALMGDIHKQQFLSPTVAYPGSLRQNNFGEDLDKGYLLWDIRKKSDFDVSYIILEQKTLFYTFEVDNVNNFINKKLNIKEGSRVRIKPLNEFSISEESLLKESLKTKYKLATSPAIIPFEKEEEVKIELDDGTVINENIREEDIQKRLIEQYLKSILIEDEDLIKKVVELDKTYHSYIDHSPRGITWSPKKFKWENFFSYGKDNVLDFSKKNGIIGIFGENGSGKSSILDSFCFGLFSKINKEGANRNGDYVHNKEQEASTTQIIESEGVDWTIDRKIKNKKTKAGKVNTTNEVDFYRMIGKKVSENQEDIVQTNAAIQKTFGTLEDFNTTSVISQFGLMSLIDAKKTERKKTYAKFFDLEIFEEKFQLANEDFKLIKAQLEKFENSNLVENLCKNKSLLEEVQLDLLSLEKEKSKYQRLLEKTIGKISSSGLIAQEKRESLEKKIEILTQKVQKLSDEVANMEKLLLQYEECKMSEKELVKKMSDLEEWTSQIKLLQKEKSNLEKRVLVLNDIPGEEICKSCSLVKDVYQSKPDIVKIGAKINKLQEKIEDLPTKEEMQIALSQLRKKESLLRDLDFKKSSLSLEDETLKNIKSSLQDIPVPETKENIDKLKDLKKQLEEKVNLLSSEILSKTRDAGKYEGIILSLNEEIEKKEEFVEKYRIYQLYTKCMNKDGIAYMVLSKKIPVIESEVNKILSQVVNFKFKIVNDEKEKSIGYYIQDPDCGETIAELASGGEKTIISIALRTALWKNCHLPKCDMLFLDEPFGSLDSERYYSMIDLLAYLKNYFKVIFIVSHNEDIKTSMDSILYVKKEDGYSTLVAG